MAASVCENAVPMVPLLSGDVVLMLKGALAIVAVKALLAVLLALSVT